VKSLAIRSDQERVHEILVQLQRNRNKKQFIELGSKSLVWVWVTFPLPAILIFCGGVISVQGVGVKKCLDLSMNSHQQICNCDLES